MVTLHLESSGHACKLNNLGAILIKQGLCIAGVRILQESSRAIRDQLHSNCDDEGKELERLLRSLQEQTAGMSYKLPLLYKAGSKFHLEEGKPPSLPFPDHFLICDEEQGVEPQHCCEAVIFNLGVVHYEIGTVEHAKACFRLALTTSSELAIKTACFNNLVMIQCYQGHTVDSATVDALQNQLEQESHGQDHDPYLLARSLVTAGYVQFCQCNFQAAMALCLKAQQLQNLSKADKACLCYNLGLLCYHLQDWQSALHHLHTFVTTCSSSNHSVPRALYYIGAAQQSQGNLRLAFQSLLQSVTRVPESAESWYRIATVLHDSDDFGSALRAYREALKYTHGSTISAAKIHMDIGRIHHVQCSIVESIQAYIEALRIVRHCLGESNAYAGKLLTIIGNLCMERGHVQEAMLAFANAMRILPHELVGHHQLPYSSSLHAACA